MSHLADDRYAKALRSHDSLAPLTARLQELNWEKCEPVSVFYKSDQTKDSSEIWRMQYYSIGTQD